MKSELLEEKLSGSLFFMLAYFNETGEPTIKNQIWQVIFIQAISFILFLGFETLDFPPFSIPFIITDEVFAKDREF